MQSVGSITFICVLFWPISIWDNRGKWSKIWGNIGTGNGLLPNSTKPSPEINVDYPSVRSCDIRPRMISQEMHKIIVLYMGGPMS